MKRSMSIIIFVLMTFLVQGQDRKILGYWILTAVEYQDSISFRGESTHNRWMEFYDNHTMRHGMYPSQSSGKGTWEFDKKQMSISIKYDLSIDNKTIWKIKKIKRKTLVIGETYPFFIFKKKGIH